MLRRLRIVDVVGVEHDLRRFYEVPAGEPDAILAVCDTAAGGGDFTVLPVFAVYGQDHYMIDCVCSDALPEVTDVLCSDVLTRNKVQKCQFESNAAGGRTADKVHDLIASKGRFCHITKKWTSTNKETKVIVESTWVKQNCLFLDAKLIKRGSPYGIFMQQMLGYTFTGKNAHDDVPDALAQYSKFYQSFLGIEAKLLDRKSIGI